MSATVVPSGRLSVRARLAVLRHAAGCGFADYSAMYSWRTWLGGWLSRVLCQVAFFALVGQLIGSAEATRHLFVGNVAMIAAMEACLVCASTAWERQSGTLPLLVAAPASHLLVFAGRSVFWLVSGTATATVALFALAPLFGVALAWPAALLAPLVLAVVAAATYCFALVLAGVVLRVLELRNVASNSTYLVLMALCGVQVPVAYWPGWVQGIAACLPVGHGLQALRELLDGAALAVVGRLVLLECAVGAAWLVVAALVFDRLVDGGRRTGAIEFGG